jgi:hypothetical protein
LKTEHKVSSEYISSFLLPDSTLLPILICSKHTQSANRTYKGPGSNVLVDQFLTSARKFKPNQEQMDFIPTDVLDGRGFIVTKRGALYHALVILRSITTTYLLQWKQQLRH